MIRGVIYRLIEPRASMGHSFTWKLICAISVCNTLTVGVHLSSTPSISGPGSATASSYGPLFMKIHHLKQCPLSNSLTEFYETWSHCLVP